MGTLNIRKRMEFKHLCAYRICISESVDHNLLYNGYDVHMNLGMKMRGFMFTSSQMAEVDFCLQLENGQSSSFMVVSL